MFDDRPQITHLEKSPPSSTLSQEGIPTVDGNRLLLDIKRIANSPLESLKLGTVDLYESTSPPPSPLEALRELERNGQATKEQLNQLKGYEEFPDNMRAGKLAGKELNKEATPEDLNALSGYRQFPNSEYAGYLAGLKLNKKATPEQLNQLAGYEEFPDNENAAYLAGLELNNKATAEQRKQLRAYRREANPK